jgi:hypothetical protein
MFIYVRQLYNKHYVYNCFFFFFICKIQVLSEYTQYS